MQIVREKQSEIFPKSKFSRKLKIDTALDSVFCQLYNYEIKFDFL